MFKLTLGALAGFTIAVGALSTYIFGYSVGREVGLTEALVHKNEDASL